MRFPDRPSSTVRERIHVRGRRVRGIRPDPLPDLPAAGPGPRRLRVPHHGAVLEQEVQSASDVLRSRHDCTLIDPPLIRSCTRSHLAHASESGAEALARVLRGDRRAVLLSAAGSGAILAASLRVYETSKQAENHGVEIPVVRAEDFGAVRSRCSTFRSIRSSASRCGSTVSISAKM